MSEETFAHTDTAAEAIGVAVLDLFEQGATTVIVQDDGRDGFEVFSCDLVENGGSAE